MLVSETFSQWHDHDDTLFQQLRINSKWGFIYFRRVSFDVILWARCSPYAGNFVDGGALDENYKLKTR